MAAIPSLAFTLACLLSAASAASSTFRSSEPQRTSVSHRNEPLPEETQLRVKGVADTYLPPLKSQVQLPQRLSIQSQERLSADSLPPAAHQGLHLLPLPATNSAPENSFFFSPLDSAIYKVTRITLKEHTPSGHSTTTQPPSTASIDFGLLPPTPPLPPIPAITRDPSRRPYFRIRLSAYENIGPQSGCNGGGEGRNPALTPIFGEEPGCPPAAPVTGSPQFGVPEPLSFQQPKSSEAPPYPPFHSSRVPASSSGASPAITLQDDGQAGTGRTGGTSAQASAATGIDLDIQGGFK